MRCLSHLATLHLAALLSQQAAVSLPCPSALQKKSIILRFSAVPLAPFVAHWLAAVDVGICECCPAWLTGSFITWLPCWDNTAGNHQARRKAWLWLFPQCCPTQLPKAGQNSLHSGSIHAIYSNCVELLFDHLCAFLPQDIVLTLKEKLSIRSIAHFALTLEEQYNAAKIHLLHEEELIEQVWRAPALPHSRVGSQHQRAVAGEVQRGRALQVSQVGLDIFSLCERQPPEEQHFQQHLYPCREPSGQYLWADAAQSM